MTFTLPELPFAYDALEPHMSKETFEYHHDKHHLAYINKANELIAGTGQEGRSVEEVMIWSHAINEALFNQVGQHFNHSFFWKSLSPDGGGKNMPIELKDKINESFGSFNSFRKEFITAGMTQFGSGWCWLVKDNATGKLEVMKTSNAINPLVQGKTPLITCDVWEHSYYIDYRNARPTYLESFIDNMANWEYAASRLNADSIDIAAEE